MRVLVQYERTQAVTKRMRQKGHIAFSCDIKPAAGGHSEWHIQDDAIKTFYAYGPWDMVIAFPPCTHLALSGARWFDRKRNNGKQKEGIELFVRTWEQPISKLVVENPMGIMSGGTYLAQHFPEYLERGWPRKQSQIIHPFYFGDRAQKATCLWIRGLPTLQHRAAPDLFSSKITHTDPGEFFTAPSGRKYNAWHQNTGGGSGDKRSETWPGIAQAMADQWG